MRVWCSFMIVVSHRVRRSMIMCLLCTSTNIKLCRMWLMFWRRETHDGASWLHCHLLSRWLPYWSSISTSMLTSYANSNTSAATPRVRYLVEKDWGAISKYVLLGHRNWYDCSVAKPAYRKSKFSAQPACKLQIAQSSFLSSATTVSGKAKLGIACYSRW